MCFQNVNSVISESTQMGISGEGERFCSGFTGHVVDQHKAVYFNTSLHY